MLEIVFTADGFAYNVSVTLRLAPLLPTTVASVQFPDVKAAVEASIQILRSGIAASIRKLHFQIFLMYCRYTNLQNA
jgi:D-lactate dehydrogenase (cytochrome)